MRIDGTTAVLVHLACPAAHLQTPQAFNARCAERGINAVLVPWQVKPAKLPAMMSALRDAESVAGAIVTIPHKEAAATLCDRLDGVAALIGVTNVIQRDAEGTLTGRILDGEGFVGGLRAHGFEPAGRTALVVGAGGVAIAIAAALAEAGAARIVLANRTRARAEAAVARLRAFAEARGFAGAIEVGEAEPSGFDLVVNATALGMHAGDALPVQPARIAAGATVAEVVMAPAETRLLAAAAARGARVVPGRAMLGGQIDPFIDFVLGTSNDKTQVRRGR